MQCEILDSNNDWIPITSLIKDDGWSETINSIDGPNAGRNMLGTMIRDWICDKLSVNVTLKVISKTQKDLILSLIRRESFSMRYKDDADLSWTTLSVYSNGVSWKRRFTNPSGIEYFSDFTFPFIEM